MSCARVLTRSPAAALAAAALLAAGCFDFALPARVDAGSIECAGGRKDPATGLCWEYPPSGQQLSWLGAEGYCEGLAIEGEDTWRLPTAEEIAGLLDECDIDFAVQESGACTKCAESGTCDALFPDDSLLGRVWTATACSFYESCRWSADLFSGSFATADLANDWQNATICVRGGADGGTGE